MTAKKGHKAKVAIAKDKLTAIVERLRNDSTSLIHESKALGFTTNGRLRKELKELLGDRGYYALFHSKAAKSSPAKKRVRKTTSNGGGK